MEANGIVLSPDPRLRQECAVIEEITPAIEALAEKMKKMMFENGGCGLAAPQIGELIQLVTIDCDYNDKNDYDPYVLINPVIVDSMEHKSGAVIARKRRYLRDSRRRSGIQRGWPLRP